MFLREFERDSFFVVVKLVNFLFADRDLGFAARRLRVLWVSRIILQV